MFKHNQTVFVCRHLIYNENIQQNIYEHCVVNGQNTTVNNLTNIDGKAAAKNYQYYMR